MRFFIFIFLVSSSTNHNVRSENQLFFLINNIPSKIKFISKSNVEFDINQESSAPFLHRVTFNKHSTSMRQLCVFSTINVKKCTAKCWCNILFYFNAKSKEHSGGNSSMSSYLVLKDKS